MPPLLVLATMLAIVVTLPVVGAAMMVEAVPILLLGNVAPKPPGSRRPMSKTKRA